MRRAAESTTTVVSPTAAAAPTRASAAPGRQYSQSGWPVPSVLRANCPDASNVSAGPIHTRPPDQDQADLPSHGKGAFAFASGLGKSRVVFPRGAAEDNAVMLQVDDPVDAVRPGRHEHRPSAGRLRPVDRGRKCGGVVRLPVPFAPASRTLATTFGSGSGRRSGRIRRRNSWGYSHSCWAISRIPPRSRRWSSRGRRPVQRRTRQRTGKAAALTARPTREPSRYLIAALLNCATAGQIRTADLIVFTMMAKSEISGVRPGSRLVTLLSGWSCGRASGVSRRLALWRRQGG